MTLTYNDFENALSALGYPTSGYNYHDENIKVYDPFDDQLLITVGKDNLFDITTYPRAIKDNGGDHIEDVLNLSYELATTPIDDRAEARPCRYRMDAPVSHRKGANLNTADPIDTSQAFYLAKNHRQGWFITSDLDIGDEERVDFDDTVFTNDDIADLDLSGFVEEPLTGRVKFKWLD